MRSHVPFTDSTEMPAIIPAGSPVARLLMQKAHKVRHGGQDDTLSEFRRMGFWTVGGGKLAKSCSGTRNCRICQKLDPEVMGEVMGEIPREVLEQKEGWGMVQLDLMGPFSVRSDVNPRTTKKAWVMVVEDVGTGAVHVDVLRDYSAQEVITTLWQSERLASRDSN